MTDPGERLRSSLAADSRPDGPPADFDSPIAMEALRATRVLHAADQEPFPVPGRTRVITVANQKGGVGKTTSTVNLGVALALYGLRTLVIDLDPQGNASTALGVEHSVGTPSIYDALVADSTLADVVHPATASPKLRCVPARTTCSSTAHRRWGCSPSTRWWPATRCSSPSSASTTRWRASAS